MGGDDEPLDVHETGYVRGGATGPADDTTVHTKDAVLDPDRSAPVTVRPQSHSHSDILPNLRASLRSQEEVERERASTKAAVPVVLIVVVVLAVAGFGLLVLGIGATVIFAVAPDPTPPADHEGIPIRQRLGDE